MSAATNDTNNITTSISIAVPDRILNAIEWTVQSLTDALSETLMQYQSSHGLSHHRVVLMECSMSIDVYVDIA